jgi:hypothetical protein
MTEEWRKIPGYPAYEVSDTGNVRSFWVRAAKHTCVTKRPRRVLKQLKVKGYLHVVLCTESGERTQITVHSLVLLAFVGPRPEGFEVCHNDGNGTNNRLENLRYDTPRGNALDRFRHESWLPESAVIAIRERYAQGEHTSEIAEAHGISRGHVYSICKGECYKVYGGPVDRETRRSGASGLSTDDLVEMIQLRDAGMGYRAIGARFGVTDSYVCHIFKGNRMQEQFAQARRRAAQQEV